jgi:flagellar biogenesis protein FliO
VVAAVSTVAVLLAATLLGLRWLFQRMERSSGTARLRRVVSGSTSWLSRWVPPASAPEDRVDIVGRSHVGPKESVCIVRVAKERFLIGVTAHRVSLLGRLEPAGERVERGDAKPAMPKVDDFAIELSGAVAARPLPGESSMRSMLARSRERLAKLGVDSVHAGGRRA